MFDTEYTDLPSAYQVNVPACLAVVRDRKIRVRVGTLARTHTRFELIKRVVEPKWTCLVLTRARTSILWQVLLVLDLMKRKR